MYICEHFTVKPAQSKETLPYSVLNFPDTMKKIVGTLISAKKEITELLTVTAKPRSGSVCYLIKS